MGFCFETVIDRAGHDSLAIDGLGHGDWAPAAPKEGFDVIPMWVADMGFATAPAVTEAMERRLAHPIFGYFEQPDAYFDAIASWHERRNGVTGMAREHIGYENGVLGGVMSALAVLCSQGDKVLVHSPCYIGFTGAVGGAGYELVHSPLYLDESGVWRMDFEDMERRIVEGKIHVAIFCSPHNPCGRVWEREEIERAMEVFERHDVWVISDEIWSDLVFGPRPHTPTQSVSKWAREHTVAFYAPSKTFNLAGLVGSYHVIYNAWLRDRVERAGALGHYNSQNVLAMHALIGGYSAEGEAWVDELRGVLAKNVRTVCDHVNACWPGVVVSPAEGTYVLLLDCETWCEEHGVSNDDVVRRAWDVGVAWHDGRLFGCPWCVRLNIALPPVQIEEALARLDRHVFCD
jgi:cystathionine beta-lyase